MPSTPDPLPGDPPSSFQLQFHSRWDHLRDRHVRALAWLLYAPDLLDWQAPQWQGKIARLVPEPQLDDWLAALDVSPAPLHAWLDLQPRLRLGRYAEKLIAYYFHQRGMLAAYGVQVQDEKHTTIGEFDFLLRHGDALVHWEFATKFYLLQAGGSNLGGYFMGPSLADMLNTKMRKVLERQLTLGQHPAAQIHLPQALASAKALIKGWLFYRTDAEADTQSAGLSAQHCRGFWCALDELSGLPQDQYIVLPRLDWLAPAKVPLADSVSRTQLQALLATYFRANRTPPLVARLQPQPGGSDELGWEMERGFVVPNDWQQRARERITALEAPD